MAEPHEHGEMEVESMVEKIHAHDSSSSSSSSSSSDSDDERRNPTALLKSKIYRLFGREKPVHKVLGGGQWADVLLWRDKKVSSAFLGGATTIWVLFEVLDYHLITLVCHILIIALVIAFLWSNASSFISKSVPQIPDVYIPEEPVFQVASSLRPVINQALSELRDLASGKDLKKFLTVVSGLWILSTVGNWFSVLTLIYIVVVLLHTVPIFYENYEDHVDSYAEKAIAEFKKQYAVYGAKVLSKIRGPFKDKKNA